MTPNQPSPGGSPTKPSAGPRTAAEILRPITLSEEAAALLTPTLTIRQFLDLLVGPAFLDDAIRVMAVGLPKPESIWWACLCVRSRLPKPLPAASESAIAAAEKWVLEPTDSQRRAAGSLADSVGWDTAAGGVAGAVWLSGGSLSPPSLPPVTPREDLTGRSIAGALMIAAAHDPATSALAKQQFLALGMKIASGQVKKGDKAGL